MLRKLLVTLMLAGVALGAAAETVYKWVDSRGQVHYTDLPPREPGARLLSTFQGSVSLMAEAGDDATDSTGEATDGPLPPGFAESDAPNSDTRAAAAEVQQDLQARRAEQCKVAQARYTQYIESRRLYSQTADGERVYLSEAELAKARVDAKQEVNELCGTGNP